MKRWNSRFSSSGVKAPVMKRGELGEIQRQIAEATRRMGLAEVKFGSQSIKKKKR